MARRRPTSCSSFFFPWRRVIQRLSWGFGEGEEEEEEEEEEGEGEEGGEGVGEDEGSIFLFCPSWGEGGGRERRGVKEKG